MSKKVLLSSLIQWAQESLEKYGDIEGDVLVEDFKKFGQIEQQFGGWAISPGNGKDRPARFKLLSKDFS